MSKEVASAYFHIGNSGVTFSVVDEGFGPCIRISSSAFGNNQIKQDVLVTKNELLALAEMFAYACTKNYSEEYCHPARVSSTKPLNLLKDDMTPAEDKCMSYEPLSNPYAGKGCNPFVKIQDASPKMKRKMTRDDLPKECYKVPEQPEKYSDE